MAKRKSRSRSKPKAAPIKLEVRTNKRTAGVILVGLALIALAVYLVVRYLKKTNGSGSGSDAPSAGGEAQAKTRSFGIGKSQDALAQGNFNMPPDTGDPSPVANAAQMPQAGGMQGAVYPQEPGVPQQGIRTQAGPVTAGVGQSRGQVVPQQGALAASGPVPNAPRPQQQPGSNSSSTRGQGAAGPEGMHGLVEYAHGASVGELSVAQDIQSAFRKGVRDPVLQAHGGGKGRDERSVAQKIKDEFREGVYKPVAGGGESMTGTPRLIYKPPAGVQPGTLKSPEPGMVRVKPMFDARYGFKTNGPIALVDLPSDKVPLGRLNPVVGSAYRVNAVPPSSAAPSVGGKPRVALQASLFDASDSMADWSQNRKGPVQINRSALAPAGGPGAPLAPYQLGMAKGPDSSKEMQGAMMRVERAIPMEMGATFHSWGQPNNLPDGITGRQWEGDAKEWERVKQQSRASLMKIADMFDELFREEVFPKAEVQELDGDNVRVVDGATGDCILLERYYEYVQACIATQMGTTPANSLNWATGSSLQLGLEFIQQSIPALREALTVKCKEAPGYKILPGSDKIKNRATDDFVKYDVIWPRDRGVLFTHEMTFAE